MDDYLVMGPDGRQMLKSQFDAEQQRSYNTSRLNTLLGAPVAAGVYGAMDQLGADPETRDQATGMTAGFEGIAQGALGARGGMHSEGMLAKPPKTVIGRLPGPSAVPPRADYGLSLENWQEAGHATPHKFNKFDMSKIGSGEGQFLPDLVGEYGHGMYLSTGPKTVDSYFRSIADGIQDKTGERPTMYKKRVAIPIDDKLINKDKGSFLGQPEPVKERLKAAGLTAEPSASMDTLLSRIGGQSGYASSMLEKAGIPGLKYEGLWQKTHGKQGKEVSNYIMWDESKMRPLRHDLPEHTPLVRERHRSTPDDGKSIREPDRKVIDYDPKVDGRDDAYEALKDYDPDVDGVKYVPPTQEQIESMAAEGAKLKKDTQLYDKWGNKADPDEKPENLAPSSPFYDPVTDKTNWAGMKKYTAEHTAAEGADMWSKTTKAQDAGLAKKQKTKAPDPSNDSDWNNFLAWKHKNPPDDETDIGGAWNKWVTEGSPTNSYVWQIDQLAKKGLIEKPGADDYDPFAYQKALQLQPDLTYMDWLKQEAKMSKMKAKAKK